MDTRPLVVVGAVMLFNVAVSAHAAEFTTETNAAPRVAEMLQRRQENLLREQLVKEGRMDEVRKIDEERSRQQQERQQRLVSQMNDNLARSTKSDVPGIAALLDACEKETPR